MCRQSGWRFLQSLLRFIGAAFLLTLIQSGEAAAHPTAQGTTTTQSPSNPNPSNLGQSVTFTATVSCNNVCHATTHPERYPGFAPSGVVPGVIKFMNGGSLLGASSITGNGDGKSGTATLNAVFNNAGNQNIQAMFVSNDPGMDSNFQNSQSNIVTQTVNKAATTTSVPSSSANPSSAGQSVTFTATVTATTGTPTGTVTFKDGAVCRIDLANADADG